MVRRFIVICSTFVLLNGLMLLVGCAGKICRRRDEHDKQSLTQGTHCGCPFISTHYLIYSNLQKFNFGSSIPIALSVH